MSTTIISNELELYSIKGNVNAGKIMLFKILEDKFGNDKDKIRNLVVEDYQIIEALRQKILVIMV